MKMSQITGYSLITVLTVFTGHASAGFDDWFGKLKDSITSESSQSDKSSVASLTNSDMVGALKQALDKGVTHAVSQLGQSGGFLNDKRVRIPMPEKLAWVEKSLRAVGQDKLADEFITSINSAAEKAVPEVASIFGETIKSMSLEDAKGILQGPDDSATQFFRKNSSAALTERMLPIVKQATDAAGVTSRYKSMMGKASGLMGMFNKETTDLDGYVTNKAMDGLFLMIAEEEKKIRENPLARSSELLKKVFGAF
jgi:hypothetical protein